MLTNLTTIYRTIELLRDVGLVREIHLPGEAPQYEVMEERAHPSTSSCHSESHFSLHSRSYSITTHHSSNLKFHCMRYTVIKGWKCPLWPNLQPYPVSSYETRMTNKEVISLTLLNLEYTGFQIHREYSRRRFIARIADLSAFADISAISLILFNSTIGHHRLKYPA